MEKARSQPRSRTSTVAEERELPLAEPRPPPRTRADRLASERIRDALRRWLEEEL